MKTKLILKPGQKGTKKLCEKYGPSLVCVRYRYDTAGNKRYKTVELIEEETEWTPPKKEAAETPEEIVGIPVEYKETKLQGQLKKEGAKWDPQKKNLGSRPCKSGKIGSARSNRRPRLEQ